MAILMSFGVAMKEVYIELLFIFLKEWKDGPLQTSLHK